MRNLPAWLVLAALVLSSLLCFGAYQIQPPKDTKVHTVKVVKKYEPTPAEKMLGDIPALFDVTKVDSLAAFPQPFQDVPRGIFNAHFVYAKSDVYVSVYSTGQGSTLNLPKDGWYRWDGRKRKVATKVWGDILFIITGNTKALDFVVDKLSPYCELGPKSSLGNDQARNPYYTQTPVQFTVAQTICAKDTSLPKLTQPLPLFDYSTVQKIAKTKQEKGVIVPVSPTSPPPTKPNIPQFPELSKVINVPYPEYHGPGCGWDFTRTVAPSVPDIPDMEKVRNEAVGELDEKRRKYLEEAQRFEREVQDYNSKAEPYLDYETQVFVSGN